MRIRIALSSLVIATSVAACRRDPPPVEPGTSSTAGAGGADAAIVASSTSVSSSASGGLPAGCLVPAPAPLSCRDHGDCWREHLLCSMPVCDPMGHCLYRPRDPDRDGGVVGCDPGGTSPGYWSCQGADPSSATDPGGICCPDATQLPTSDQPRVGGR